MEPAMMLSRLLTDRRLWLAVAALATVALIRWSGLGAVLSLDTLRTHRETLAGWVSSHVVIASAAYVATYVAAVAFSLPGAVFLTLAGGFLFGAALGTLLTVTGATIGAFSSGCRSNGNNIAIGAGIGLLFDFASCW